MVAAFSSNSTILSVQMSDCAINDALACRWAEVLTLSLTLTLTLTRLAACSP